VETRPGQLGTLMRTLGRQLKDKLVATLGFESLPPRPSPRVSVVEKVSRNALAELVGRAKSHPQRGQADSANPAYVALADLALESRRPALALGLRYETGEITFLDLDLVADKRVDDDQGLFPDDQNRLQGLSAEHCPIRDMEEAGEAAKLDKANLRVPVPGHPVTAASPDGGPLPHSGDSGIAFVDRAENLALWRRLEELIYYKVDSTMVGPRKPIRAPEEVDR